MRSAALLLALALVACGKPTEAPEANKAEPAPPPPPPVVEKAEPPKEAPASFDFVGDWGASEELCRDNGVWRFARDKVETDGETSCTIDSITDETATGATLNMSCVAEGTQSKQRWVLFTGPDETMIVQRYEDGVMRVPQQPLMRCPA